MIEIVNEYQIPWSSHLLAIKLVLKGDYGEGITSSVIMW